MSEAHDAVCQLSCVIPFHFPLLMLEVQHVRRRGVDYVKGSRAFFAFSADALVERGGGLAS